MLCLALEACELSLNTPIIDRCVNTSSVCICAMIRLKSLKTFGLTADPSWDNVPTTFWSTIETTAAIFCACMPAIRAGCVRLFPKVFGGTTVNSSMRSGASHWTTDSISAAKRPIGKHESIKLADLNNRKFVRIPEETHSRDQIIQGEHDGTFLEDDSLQKETSAEKELPQLPVHKT